MADLIEVTVLNCNQQLLEDPGALWRSKRAAERMKARQPFLAEGFSIRVLPPG
jgi:hypothetical protein